MLTSGSWKVSFDETGVSVGHLWCFGGSWSLAPPTVFKNLLATSILGGEYSGVVLYPCLNRNHLPPLTFGVEGALLVIKEILSGMGGVLGVLGESSTGGFSSLVATRGKPQLYVVVEV